MEKKSIISLRDVSFHYEGSEMDAVSHVTLDVREGEFLAILGRNGSGKSTLAKLFNALLVPNTGDMTVNGIHFSENADPYEIRRSCGMVFQNPDNQLVATIVEEDVAFGLENMGVPTSEIRTRVDDALATVGMSEYALSAPHMLSGGQKQRVAIAGVIAMRPKIIVFDESTAMLDPSGRAEVMKVTKKLNREEGLTIVWITHFMEEAAQSDRVIIMDKSEKVLEGTPRDVFENVEKVRAMGLDVPEMASLAHELREAGVELPLGIMTVDEMAVELCRLN